MDADVLLQRFDGRSRMLLKALLLPAVSGTRRALWVFHRQQRSEPSLFIHTFLHTLCQDEPWLDQGSLKLSLRPLVCLFPVTLKRNLLSFLHLVHHALPQPGLTCLLGRLSQDDGHDPWVQALLGQLWRDLNPVASIKDSLLTPRCRERLGVLCERLGPCGGEGAGGGGISWFGGGGGLPVPDLKRTSEVAGLDGDSAEVGSQSKRRRLDQGSPLDDREPHLGRSQLPGNVETVAMDTVPMEDAVNTSQFSPAGPGTALPEHVKASVLRIKELLETEWDTGSSSALQVLNECDPPQVEMLCAALCLSEVADQTLPQFSTSLLALTPDLSFSTAATLIRSLLLTKILSLSEPASRCLVTAATSLCSRYPRPTCCALIGPVLKAGQTGSAQAELLCRLIEDCLEPQYQLLVFEQVVTVPWSEGELSIIHSLLDSKLEISGDSFSLFTAQLSKQAPQFNKSMKFSKMLLTVLTKYQNHLRSANRRSVASCLDLNETFLKKSLQAALKRISLS